MTEQRYIKKLEQGSNSVLEVYEPLVDMIVQTGGSVALHEGFTLKSIDSFFGSNSILFIYYECFRTSDNKRQYLFIKYNTIDKKSDILIFDSDYGNFSNMPEGEFSGASTNYYLLAGTMEKYIVFSGSDTSVISLTNDSPITMVLISRRVLYNSGKYYMVYQGFHYPNTRISKSEGLPSTIMSLQMNLYSLIISADSSDTLDNRSLYYAYMSNCIKEFSSIGASICGGRGALN